MPLHTDRGYESQLGKLRSCLLEMGGLVEDQIAQAIRCLTERDRALAGFTIERDHTVNRLDVEIDDLSLKLLALTFVLNIAAIIVRARMRRQSGLAH